MALARESVMRVFVKTFGCSTNLADGEVLAGCLSEAGFEIVCSPEDADVLVFNTCAVKTPTENRMFDLLRHVSRGKKLIVAGCLPLINFERLCREVRFDGVVGPAFGEGIVDVVREVLRGKRVVLLDEGCLSVKPSLRLPRLRVNSVVGIVPVCYGCLGSCAYCCVRFARGRLRSYGVDVIVDRLRRDLGVGVREFWLTGQDVACYGLDLGMNIVDLLRAVCGIEGEFFVRVGMMNPNRVLGFLDDLVDVYKVCGERGRSIEGGDRGCLFWFLHLPLQSGDDEVLRRMRRGYGMEQFRRVVDAFRRVCSGLTLATDVIVGFPGESERAFKRTLELLEEVKPDVVNVSKFFGRPKTEALRMEPKVPVGVVKERSRRVSKLVRDIALKRNMSWVGWEGKVLIDEVGKKPNSWVGRNFAYKPVVVKSKRKDLLGKFVYVRIVKAFPTYLEGELIRK